MRFFRQRTGAGRGCETQKEPIGRMTLQPNRPHPTLRPALAPASPPGSRDIYGTERRLVELRLRQPLDQRYATAEQRRVVQDQDLGPDVRFAEMVASFRDPDADGRVLQE